MFDDLGIVHFIGRPFGINGVQYSEVGSIIPSTFQVLFSIKS